MWKSEKKCAKVVKRGEKWEKVGKSSEKWTTMSVIELVRDIWMINACVEFEERSLNHSKVIALTTKLGRGGRSGGCVADENIIFPITYVSREYNYN